MLNSLKKYSHPEKCFVESTKIWLAQQNFLFKYGSIEILFELTTKILLISFAIPTKKICIVSKKMDLQIKLQNYCTIKEKILLIEIKLKKFCKKH